MKIAVQLYSLRDEIEKYGLFFALEAVAESGFDGVEFAGFHGISAETLRDKLDLLGIKAVGAHVGLDEALTEDTAKYLAALAIPSLTVPYLTREELSQDDVQAKFAAIVSAYPRLSVCYHNHDHEFDGEDLFFKTIDRIAGLGAEADIFWIKAAGLSPVSYIKALGSRLKLLHVKEMGTGGTNADCPVVGDGISDCRNAMRQAEKQGAGWAVLEYERACCSARDYLRRCCERMRTFLK